MAEISIIGFFSGVLILVILFLNLKSSPLANKLLMGVIFPFTLVQCLFYLYLTGLAIYVPVIYRMPSPFYLAMYPLAYLYVRTFIRDTKKMSKQDYLHFIPAFLHLLQMIPFYLIPMDEKRAIVADVIKNGEKMIQFKEGGLPAYAQFGLLFIQGAIYCFFSYRLILKAKLNQTSALFLSGKKWLYTFTSLMVLILIALSFSFILPSIDQLGKINWWIISIMVSMLLLTCYLFFQPNVLYGIPRLKQLDHDNLPNDISAEKELPDPRTFQKYTLSGHGELTIPNESPLTLAEIPLPLLDREDRDFSYLKAYAPDVESFFIYNRPFLNKGYSISQLSEDTGIPVHHLSALFNKVFGVRFNDYLNSYRLQYLEANLSNPDFKDYSQEGLAWQAGFNSRISFFNAVKKLRKITPAEFLSKEK